MNKNNNLPPMTAEEKQRIYALEVQMYDTVISMYGAAGFNATATVNNYIGMLRVMDKRYSDMTNHSYVNWKEINKLSERMGN